jgi:hypothetical protein
MLTVVNAGTAALPTNATGSGQIPYFDPITPANIIAGTGFVDMGALPEGTRLTPNIEVTRETLRAAGRISGASIPLQEVVTDSSIGYEFGILTPDANVKALHAGSPAATLTGNGLTGVKVYQINTEASVVGRFVLVKQRPGGPHDVIFHPRVQLSSNGTTSGDLNTEIYGFVMSVQAYNWVPNADLTGIGTVTQYGALFVAQNDAELDALLTALNDEALPA